MTAPWLETAGYLHPQAQRIRITKLTLKETAPALPSLFLPSMAANAFSSCLSYSSTHSQTCSLHAQGASLSHPAHRRTTAKVCTIPAEALPQVTQQMNLPTERQNEQHNLQRGGLYEAFGVTHTCHFYPSLKALFCKGMRSPKGPISLCIKIVAQH